MVNRLLTSGADVNAKATSGFGRTALQEAVEQGNLEIFNRLSKSGANVNAKADPDSG